MTPRAAVWSGRVVWLLVGICGWLALGEALDGRSTTAALVVSVIAWLVFGVTLAALVVPSTVSLTVVRVASPLAVVGAVVALTAGTGPVRGALFLGVALLAALVVAGGDTGEAFAQASAYGDEQRFPLRPPVGLLVPVAVTWLAWAAAATAGTVLLAASRWWFGGILIVVAVAAAWPLGRRYHRLSRRWLVVVPAGVVVHDHVVLAETLLVQRGALAVIGLALAGTESADLTGPASGHAVEVSVRDTIKVALSASPAHPDGRGIHARSFLIAPSRPGRALAAANARGLPVS